MHIPGSMLPWDHERSHFPAHRLRLFGLAFQVIGVRMGNGTLTGTDMFVAVAAAIQANERQLPERQTDPAGPKCEAQILVARDSDPIPDSQEFDRVAMRDISP